MSTRVEDMRFYVKELNGEECQCGGKKKAGHSFCYGCFCRLTPPLKRDLYLTMGQGYEEAYEATAKHLSLTEGAEG